MIGFVETEMEQMLAACYYWDLARRGSPVRLVETYDEAEPLVEHKRRTLVAVRKFAKDNAERLLAIGGKVDPEATPDKKQAEFVTNLVNEVLEHFEPWESVLDSFYGEVMPGLAIPFDGLLALIGVEVFRLSPYAPSDAVGA